MNVMEPGTRVRMDSRTRLVGQARHEGQMRVRSSRFRNFKSRTSRAAALTDLFSILLWTIEEKVKL
jgi:hypothetical protein